MESLNRAAQEDLERAPFLFSEQTIAELTAAERRGEYTLERLREQKPELIDEIIRLRGQWVGQIRIGKICKVHHRTVAAVCMAYPEEIQQEQRRRVSRLRSAADKLVELVDENPESVPPNVRCLAASQLFDKAQLFDSQPTEITEHRERVNIFAEFRAMTAALKMKVATEESETINGQSLANPIDIAALNCSNTGPQSREISAISKPGTAGVQTPGEQARPTAESEDAG